MAASVAFGYGGIVKHLLNYPGGLDAYSSMTAYVIAIGINVFGLVLNVIAVSGRSNNSAPVAS